MSIKKTAILAVKKNLIDYDDNRSFAFMLGANLALVDFENNANTEDGEWLSYSMDGNIYPMGSSDSDAFDFGYKEIFNEIFIQTAITREL